MIINGSTTFTELEELLEREGLVIRSVTKLRGSKGYDAVLELKVTGSNIFAAVRAQVPARFTESADTIAQALSRAIATARSAR